ncbi:hypothetical protein F4813DRAFT_392435 [Daldinia decipiens]|uniref:uncharacterized protein n=1 Tax=Daldinia decipiens TaxID=326647 RepID=UPI0020C1EAF0|nr:uncharacterized protein F4813DRAFT_392435 [Daldinia decipiens]KAI1654682.1 hypothetical protein F4813DRAFT_392435 [Daldinia decipiens]
MSTMTWIEHIPLVLSISGLCHSLLTNWLNTFCSFDLESDLKDKHLHVWHAGRYTGPKPDDDEFKDGSWVFGEDPQLLTWEDVTEGRDVAGLHKSEELSPL